MDDELRQYFTSRDKRLDSMSPEKRDKLAAIASRQENPEAFIDRALVSKWMSQRTGLTPVDMEDNLDRAMGYYFGTNDPSAVFDQISQNYERWSGIVELAGLGESARKRSYKERGYLSNVSRTYGASAVGGTISMGEGFVRLLDASSQGPQSATPMAMYGMEGWSAPGAWTPDQIKDYTYTPGPWADAADAIWGMKNEVTGLFDLDPEFQESLSGRLAGGAGSMVPQVGAFLLSPEIGFFALGSSSFAEATDHYWSSLGITPDQATPEQRQEAFGVGMAYSIPSAMWNAWGLEGLIGEGLKGSIKGMTKKEALKQIGRVTRSRLVRGGLKEASTEVMDGIWSIAMTRISSMPDEKLFTYDALKDLFLDAASAFIIGGVTSGGLTPLRMLAEPLQGRNTKFDAAMFIPATETPMLTEQEISVLRKQNTTEEGLNEEAIRSTCEDPEMGQLLVDAVKGDKEAAEAYNALLVQRDQDASPEVSLASLEDFEAEANALSLDTEVDEDGNLATPFPAVTEEDLSEMTQIIYEEAESFMDEGWPGRAEAMKQAREIAGGMYSYANEKLVISRAARSLGLGRLSKQDERILLEKAKADFRENVAKIYGDMRVTAEKSKAAARLTAKLAEIRTRNADRITRIYARRDRNQTVGILKREVKSLSDRMTAAEKGRKPFRNANAKAIRGYIKSISEPPSADLKTRYEKITSRMEDPNWDGSLTEDEKAIMSEVERPRLGDKDLGITEARRMLADLNSIVSEGISIRAKRDKEKAARIQLAALQMADEINVRNSEVGAREKGAFGRDVSQGAIRRILGRPVNTVKDFFAGIKVMTTIGTILTGKERGSFFEANMIDPVREAGNMEYGLNLAAGNQINRIFTEEGVSAKQMLERLVDSKGKPVVIGGSSLSITEACAVYAHSRNEGNLASLLNTKKIGGDKVTQAEVDQIVSALPDRFKRLVERIGKEYLEATERNVVNQWHTRKYGVPIAEEPNYFPKPNTESSDAHIRDVLSASAWRRKGVKTGFAKGRVGGKQGFLSLDYLQDLSRHVAAVNHAVAYDETLTDIRRVLSDEGVRDAIAARSPELNRSISHWVNVLAQGREDESKNAINRMALGLRRLASRAYLAYRPSPAAKVFASFPMGARYIPPKNVFEALLKTPAQRSVMMERMFRESRSAEVKSRLNSYRNVLREASNPKSKWKSFLEDKSGVTNFDGWWMMHVAEANQTTVLWNAAKDSRLERGESDLEATKYADWVIENTQQSGELANLPENLTSDVFSRNIMAFKNDVMHSFNGLVRIMAEKGTPIHKARRLVSYAVFDMMLPGLWLASVKKGDRVLRDIMVGASAAILGFEEPESRDKRTEGQKFWDDVLRYGIMNPVSAIPGLDTVADFIISKAEGTRPMESGNIVSAAASTLEQERYITALGLLLGVPGTPYFGAMLDKPARDAVNTFFEEAAEQLGIENEDYENVSY